MAKILVSGGPVHAKLDAVKIVTNQFRGTRMAALAKALETYNHEVTYLTSKHTIPPHKLRVPVSTHDGFVDYMERIEMLAPKYDMLVLGAAVANLVPEPKAWTLDEKFPSHAYKEGDLVNIPFRVAPRVINLVKEANPYCTLIGFKLLQGVRDEELVRAAYTVALEAKADLVVANDRANLDRKLLVTKERSVIEINVEELAGVLNTMARDQHYKTVQTYSYEVPDNQPVTVVARIMRRAVRRYRTLVDRFRSEMEQYGRAQGDHLFGCVAVRSVNNGFICSKRGKKDLSEFVHVAEVVHPFRRVHSIQGKASLNAPLLDKIFKANPRAKAVIHIHRRRPNLPQLPYAPPGTVRDSLRDLPEGDFEIEHHGVFHVITELP